MTHALATGTGTLYVVATPIGNRDDITQRAIDTLKTVDLILAEDTRHSLQLLTALGIKNNLSSFHAHNESDKSQQVIDQLLAGKSIALISDAGTPLISDPGFPLVRQARQQNIPVVPIPGACALITALSASGVPCDAFIFSGFLPAKKNARKTKLTSLAAQPYSLIFYESTHRIMACLDDIAEVFGAACEVVLAKELTKSFEHFISGTVPEIQAWLQAEAGRTNGEFVLIIPPRPTEVEQHAQEELLTILLGELPLKQAVNIAHSITQVGKNELYELALRIKAGN